MLLANQYQAKAEVKIGKPVSAIATKVEYSKSSKNFPTTPSGNWLKSNYAGKSLLFVVASNPKEVRKTTISGSKTLNVPVRAANRLKNADF
ncbi:hypothetical protein [Dolichospermum sp. UHCC 0259]|uniref:hypothetical protein n=1 Tax=Dolichospermum sp. UHCC 0259 TaxID=2590010 RepID=UPI001445BE90|nr:hypothetical protein [Dolichospermum sp. UHCC 0259]